MKKILKLFTPSKIILATLLLLNIALWLLLVQFASTYSYMAVSLVGLIIFLSIMNDASESASYKIMWMLVFIVLPIFAVVLYMQLRSTTLPVRLRRLHGNITKQSVDNACQEENTMVSLNKFDPQASNLSQYLYNTEHWPIYSTSNTMYFGEGAEYFDHMFDCIASAQHFVLLEFFIIEPGQLWDRLLSILRSKAEQGVEIKILYDDFGCMDRFDNKHYLHNLKQYGIQTAPFNTIKPTINKFNQLRSHRKIVVVDGNYAYTGGMNIGDEYANITSPLGHWKDAGLRICGKPVWSMTRMFMDNWQLATGKLVDITKYHTANTVTTDTADREYIQPYGPNPLTKTPTARDIYIKLINSAKKSIYITTPYLILDYEIILALRLASQSGVDVKIFMPNTPDKPNVFYLGRTYYKDLIEKGIEIYQYTPGFLHAKVVLVDNTTATVGSINMDFRSLYLHFEVSVLIHNSIALLDIQKDMQHLTQVSQLITLEQLGQRKLKEKIIGTLLRLVAPLM